MPKISKYILGVQCSLTKVNERFWLKEGLIDGFQNMVRMLDNLLI